MRGETENDADAWKGEHLIRGLHVKGEATRQVNKIFHRQRREAGIPAPAAKAHSRIVKGIFHPPAKEPRT